MTTARTAPTDHTDHPGRPATKVVVVLRDDLAPWQVANVTAFLAAGVAAGVPGLVGEPYADADGNAYLPTLGLPVIVRAADAATLAGCRARAVARGLPTAIYTSPMFGTGNDQDNRAVVAADRAEALDLVGLAVHGPRNAVDKIVKGTAAHP